MRTDVLDICLVNHHHRKRLELKLRASGNCERNQVLAFLVENAAGETGSIAVFFTDSSTETRQLKPNNTEHAASKRTDIETANREQQELLDQTSQLRADLDLERSKRDAAQAQASELKAKLNELAAAKDQLVSEKSELDAEINRLTDQVKLQVRLNLFGS